MPKTAITQIAVIGIDIGKNSFHVAKTELIALTCRNPTQFEARSKGGSSPALKTTWILLEAQPGKRFTLAEL